jgi:beta-aspartyl-peptidase (threonine type)
LQTAQDNLLSHTYAQEIAISGCRDAVVKGGEYLRYGSSALDAAIAACVALEDNPIFNAGTGSVLNYDGEAQMDASLMEGHTLRFGAVAAIEQVKNPVLVARKVIEETDHSILVGAGAIAFARQVGFPDHNPRTSERIAEHRMLRAKVPQGELRISRFSAGHPEHAHSATTGTVGAVALDSQGNLAAATSTGGIALKLPGRVGDTPLPGCGTYATAYGAASSTGTGEFVMRVLGARQVCDSIESGHTAQTAVERTLQQIQTSFAAETGLIAIDRTGNIGIAHRTPEMPHAFFSSNSAITARIRI